MDYKEIVISLADPELNDVLIALLSDRGYEGFTEAETELKAYIQADSFESEELAALLAQYPLTYTVNDIAQQNWNASWEQNFDPVIVDDLCVIRADFHPPAANTRYEIVITPKMSFGTGHHATTQLMIRQMGLLDFKDKTVFDFGTGTGVLAILAQKMGAAKALAIDNDEWSYQNAMENVQRNTANGVTVSMDDITALGEQKFDIILANINRHILLAYMETLHALCQQGGRVIMSGLLVDDEKIIVQAATSAGFISENRMELNGWIALLFSRPTIQH